VAGSAASGRFRVILIVEASPSPDAAARLPAAILSDPDAAVKEPHLSTNVPEN
jgi:hypothetical protein